MLPGKPHPFPREVVRDLLGVVRALYRAGRESGADPAQLKRLAAIGKSLAVAVDLGKHDPNTMGARAAWKRAEEACLELGGVVDLLGLSGQPVVDAATKAVSEAGRRKA